MSPTTGHVLAVRSSVIDIRFGEGELPPVDTAVEILWDGEHRLTAEIQQHLDATTARAVALHATTGLRRGTAVAATGMPIAVPVGDAVLGRLIDVVGDPTDGRRSHPPSRAGRPAERRRHSTSSKASGRYS